MLVLLLSIILIFVYSLPVLLQLGRRLLLKAKYINIISCMVFAVKEDQRVLSLLLLDYYFPQISLVFLSENGCLINVIIQILIFDNAYSLRVQHMDQLLNVLKSVFECKNFKIWVKVNFGIPLYFGEDKRNC